MKQKHIRKNSLKVKKTKELIVYRVNDGEIISTSLFEHVMSKAERIKESNKDTPIYHIRINGIPVSYSGNDLIIDNIQIDSIELWSWGIYGNTPHYLNSFKNIEEAENELFRHVYHSEYMLSTNKSALYLTTLEEAEHILTDPYSIKWNVDFEVSFNILRKQKIVKKLREEKEAERIRLKQEKKEEVSIKLSQIIERKNNEDIEINGNIF